MTRRMIEREYAPEECDEVCQNTLIRDRNEVYERTNRNTNNCGCERRRCNCETRCNDNEVLNRRNNFARGTRISGEECPTEEQNNCQWIDPCRCNCGCNNWNRCGCNQWNRCGRGRCGCTRGLNCDRNRRLRSCGCNCTCNEE